MPWADEETKIHQVGITQDHSQQPSPLPSYPTRSQCFPGPLPGSSLDWPRAVCPQVSSVTFPWHPGVSGQVVMVACALLCSFPVEGPPTEATTALLGGHLSLPGLERPFSFSALLHS
jgi:hypothetical protein